MIEYWYGPVVTGMTGPPNILDFQLDANASPPMVVFFWNGPGIDIAAEMIIWNEQNVVSKHVTYIKKNLQYGQQAHADADAEVNAAQDAQDPKLLGRQMLTDWRNGRIGNVVNAAQDAQDPKL